MESQMKGNNVSNYKLYNYHSMFSIRGCTCLEVDNICHVSQANSIETWYLIMDRYIKNRSKSPISSEM